MKIDRIPSRPRAPVYLGVSAVCAAALLAGCMGSPTYGTGKSSNMQLLEDVSGILALGPTDQPEIAYTPRGELVRPASTAILPEPQQDIASAENAAWPESPEERRRRIRQEATEYGGPHPSIVASTQQPGGQRAEVQRRIREANQGEATNRRYLSEPPLTYRTPSDGAPVGELGEDEWKKERAQARASGKSSWRDYLPW